MTANGDWEGDAASAQQSSAAMAVILSVAACVAFAGFWLLRLGLDDGPLPLLSILAFALLPVWTGAVVLGLKLRPGLKVAALAVALLLAVYIPVAGLILGRAANVGLLALPAAMFMCRDALRRQVTWRLIGSGLVIGLLLIITSSWGRILIPQLMALGVANADYLHQIARAQMAAHYGIPTLGADGLAWAPLHVGSDLISGGLSLASGAAVALVYVYWGGLALKIQFVSGLGLAILYLCDQSARDVKLRPFHLCFYALMATFVIANPESESALTGLIAFTALVPLYAWLVEAPSSNGDYRIALIAAMLGAFATTLAKVPAGFFCGGLLAWLLWRQRRSFLLAGTILLCLAVLAFVTKVYLAPINEIQWGMGVLGLLTSYAQYFTFQTAVQYGLPVLVLWLGLAGLQMRPTAGTITLHVPAREKLGMRGLLARLDGSAGYLQILAVCLIACVVVLFTVPVSSNMAWFSMVPCALAFLLLPVVLSSSGFAALSILWKPWMGFVGVAAATIVFLAWFRSDQTSNWDRVAEGVRNAGDEMPHFSDSLRRTGTPWGLVSQVIARTPWEARLRDLAGLQAEAPLVVHIPPDAAEVWRRLSLGTPYWCMAAHMMIPAEAGIVQIRSLEPKKVEDECAGDVGYVIYGYDEKAQDLHRSLPLTDADLCRQARLLGAARIYRFESITDKSRNRLIACSTSGFK